MATVSQTVEVTPTPENPTKVLKFTGYDCKTAGETTDTIEAKGYDYAIVYAVDNTKTAGAGTGRIDIRAVLPDDSAVAAYRVNNEDRTHPSETDEDGQIRDFELAVMKTINAGLLGSRVSRLPDKFTLVHNGGNSGSTTFTIDLYVELHKLSQ